MKPSSIAKLVVAGIVALFAIGILGGSFYTVDEGERGVIVSQGKIAGVAQPGFHLKKPFIDDVKYISTRTQVIEFPNEPVYTSDRQTANVTFSINYAPVVTDDVIMSIYREYQTLGGFEDRVLKRQVREHIKSVFGKFNAEAAIRERGRLNTELSTAITAIGDRQIKIEGINIENINFSDAVERAAEDRAKAEMATNTRREDLKRAEVDNQMRVNEAEAEAKAKLAAATAEAEATRLKGEAEASAIKAKSDALRDSPNLVELTKAQKWDGALPQQFVPGSTVPFLNIR